MLGTPPRGARLPLEKQKLAKLPETWEASRELETMSHTALHNSIMKIRAVVTGAEKFVSRRPR